MKVRIVVKPSRVKYSNLWHWDVEEKIGDKWVMGYIYTNGTHKFYGGIAEDKDLAIQFAKKRANDYIEDRKDHEHATRKEVVKSLTYTEEINV